MVSISGCAINRAEIAAKAKSSMIGMTKQQVLQCMGAASNTQSQENTEIWKYYSGGDYQGSFNVNTTDQYAYGSTNFHKRSCEINIIFTNDSVTNILYSGRTGGLLTQGEECAFALNNCVR
jgi:hypothetical protein